MRQCISAITGLLGRPPGASAAPRTLIEQTLVDRVEYWRRRLPIRAR
jgi:hypothetical protein